MQNNVGRGNFFRKKKSRVLKNVEGLFLKAREKMVTEPAQYLGEMDMVYAKKIRDYLKRKYQVAPSEELQKVIQTYEVYIIGDRIQKDFKKKFFSWLVGRGDQITRRNTGFPLVPEWGWRHIPEIKLVIEETIDILVDTKHGLLRLLETGPLNFEEAYIYFRFTVDIDWMLNANEYFFLNYLDFDRLDAIVPVVDELENTLQLNEEGLMPDPVGQPLPPQEPLEEIDDNQGGNASVSGSDTDEVDEIPPPIEEEPVAEAPLPPAAPAVEEVPLMDRVRAHVLDDREYEILDQALGRVNVADRLPNIEAIIEDGLDLKVKPSKKTSKAYNAYKRSLKTRYRNYYGIKKGLRNYNGKYRVRNKKNEDE